ncbi:MAG: polyribonucleotide nucleotidyltransferase [Acetobacteraceae bacterium]|nr:polyribonucleotide nucleotidyltransferase [Acetobacteraceae bacterium]
MLRLPAADGVGNQAAAEALLFPGQKTYTLELAGRSVVVEIGKLAKQANGSARVRYGDTVVLVTATLSAQPREGVDFFPLTVDYEERQYAAGRIPGNFFRREGRPTERATLASRLTDRQLRPLFPEGLRNDVQIITIVMSVDRDNPPEFCGALGASLALTVSDIPFAGPVGMVLVGRVDGRLVVNPTAEQQEKSDLHLWVAGTRDAVLMVEAGAREVPEEVVLQAIAVGHEEIKRLVEWQLSIAAEVGRPKLEVPVFQVAPEVEAAVEEGAREALRAAVRNPDKLRREADTDRVQRECLESLSRRWADQPDLQERLKQADFALKKLLRDEVRRMILDEGSRPDGRRPDSIRPVSCEVGVLPRVHGSGLFTRGQTQVLTVATLGSVGDVQMLDTLEDEEFKRFMHHYNFPPFSVGETRPLRGPSRRDVGHGALVERAIEAVLPDENAFPYTIRLVSEVLESNGSTSMASVCGSTLALMDAGVPIRAPVAGVAMGLVREGDRVAVLSDIQGVEDALGDMDFKVAGTGRGITALQMDIKTHGIDASTLARALEQAREGRLFILSRLLQALPEPRPELSPHAPRIIIVEIDPDKIRDVIGPGGKTVNRIILETGVKIDIEDDGRIYIASADMEAAQKALKMIEDLTRDVVVGGVYLGKVTRITNFGAFVEILPGKEGLVHISQLAEGRVGKVEDVVKVGDEVMVKVTEIDSLGRVNLSRREVLRSGRSLVEEKRGEDKRPTVEEKKTLDLHHRPALRNRRRRGRR